MNWFTWNYMNLVANVLYILLMLSPSVSNALPDTKQTFHMNLVVTTVALVQTDPWVLYVLSYLVRCDYHIWVDYSAGSYVCPFMLCVPSQVGTNPFQTRIHLHPYLPHFVLEPLVHLPWLIAAVTPLLLTELSYFPLLYIAVKALLYDPLLGLLHQTV